MKYNCLIILCLLYQVSLYGQHELNHWILGDSTRIEFNSLGPQTLTETPMYGFEGLSSISNQAGDLICYSNGHMLWNAADLPMYNTDSLLPYFVPTGSDYTNGSLLIPKPGDALERYYYFLQIDESINQLQYSLIDMTMDGGLGGIVDSIKGVVLTSAEIGESIHAVKHKNDIDWWILAKDQTGDENFLVTYLVSTENIELAAPIDLTISFPYKGGEISSSPDGNVLAISSSTGDNGGWFVLFKFDRNEGSVVFIDSISSAGKWYGYYGCAFAPNSRLVYTTHGGQLGRQSWIFQISWDSCKFYVDTVSSSQYSDSLILGQMELAPDNRIYYVNRPTYDSRFTDAINYLGAINYPDSIGEKCQLNEKQLLLNSPNELSPGLPNFPNYVRGEQSVACDSIVVVDTSTGLLIEPIVKPQIYPTASDGFYSISRRAELVIVYNLNGELIFEAENANYIELNNFPAGLYFVYLRIEKHQFIEKVVVN